jgi:hypothetical protein
MKSSRGSDCHHVGKLMLGLKNGFVCHRVDVLAVGAGTKYEPTILNKMCALQLKFCDQIVMWPDLSSAQNPGTVSVLSCFWALKKMAT